MTAKPFTFVSRFTELSLTILINCLLVILDEVSLEQVKYCIIQVVRSEFFPFFLIFDLDR